MFSKITASAALFSVLCALTFAAVPANADDGKQIACSAYNNATLTTTPQSNYCSAGWVGSYTWTSTKISWTCVNWNTTAKASCSAKLLSPIWGACGAVNGTTVATAPTINLCAAGTRASVSTSATRMTWTCTGANGGGNSSCGVMIKAPAVNGACGVANGTSAATAPTTNFCSTGTQASYTATATKASWVCSGANGGTTASCAATIVPVVKGACGAIANTTLNAVPTSGFCSTGTEASYALSGSKMSWTCSGSGGGASASCASTLTTVGKCGTANAVAVTTAPTANLCVAGTASSVTGSGPYTWSCNITTLTGTSASCAAPRLVSGTCGTANGATATTAPVANLCATGTATAVTSNSGYVWSCTGANGGTTASCKAPVTVSTASVATVTTLTAGTATVAASAYYPGQAITVHAAVQASSSKPTTNIVVTALVHSTDGSTIATLNSSALSLAQGVTTTAALTYTLPTNGVEFGTYKVTLSATDKDTGYVANYAVAPTFTVSPQSVDLSKLRLTFNDQFNTGALNTNVWSPFSPSNANWGDQAFMPDDWQLLSGGGLRVTAQKRSFNGKAYSGGYLTTFGGFAQTYGYFEMRAKMPKGAGLWPAFWMLPLNQSWPPEIDITEWLGKQPTISYATVHYPSSTGNQQTGGTCTSTTDLSSDYHTYGIVWKPNLLVWTLDGNACFTVTQNVPTTPMYMILDLAVGGSWGGSPTTATVFPANFDVAYVRAYQFPDSPAVAPPAISFGKTVIANSANQVIASTGTVHAGDTVRVTTNVVAGNAPLNGVTAQVVIFAYGTGTSYGGTARAVSQTVVPAGGTEALPLELTIPKTLAPGVYSIATGFTANSQTVWQWVSQTFVVQ